MSRKRHLAKAISYRIFSTIITFGLTWVVTGNPAIGAAVGGLDFAIKFVFYYLHERAWYRFGYGLMDPVTSESAPKGILSEEAS